MLSRLMTLTLLLPMLGGCSAYSLEKLRHVPPTSDPYQAALAKHYMEFSAAEEKEYDWSDSWRFADKGLLAAYGNEVSPENLADWSIPASALPELTKAREALVAALNAANRQSKPAATAEALVAFDIWVEQQEEAWEPEEISAARNRFYEALAQINGKLPDYIDTNPPLVVSDSYIAHFQLDSASLDAQAKELAAKVVDDLQREANYRVVINGHSDTSGTEPYNMTLSRRRAEAFREALIAHGIPADRIQIFAFGETDPKMATGDDVPEEINRRVEIFLSDQPSE